MADKRQRQSRTASEIKRREAEIERFVGRLDKFLFVSLEEILGDVLSGDLKGLQAAQALGGLQAALEAAGLQDILGRLTALYGDELKDIQEAFRDATGKRNVLNSLDVDITEALIRFDTASIASSINAYVDDLRSTIMRSVITGELPKFSDLHEDFGGRMLSGAKTELNTALQGFNRSVTLKKADDLGIELFLYAGPDDDEIRDFCEYKVGNIYTLDEIQSWDNGQGLPADVYLGGYNCRHRLDPVSLELARELGYEG